MKDILVIGTTPQCPRCRLLSKIMSEMNERYSWGANVRHCAYDADEAVLIAERIGLQANTAKEVAIRLNRPMDKEKINRICSEITVGECSEWVELNDCNWSIELDNEIRPYQEQARKVGILMTPILVVDGNVLWEGSVPSRKMIYEMFKIE